MDNTNSKFLSVTDREFGALEQDLRELKHKFRNIQTIMNISGAVALTKEEVYELKLFLATSNKMFKSNSEMIEELNKKMSYMNDEVNRLKIKIYTAFSVIGILFTVVVWLVDLAFMVKGNI